jgi:hypothetical protein
LDKSGARLFYTRKPNTMPQPPVPVLFLYDPNEFWESIRQLIREELAKANSRQAIYTPDDVTRIFQIPKSTLDDWTRQGILKPVKILGAVYFLHSDLEHLFRTPPTEPAATG